MDVTTFKCDINSAQHHRALSVAVESSSCLDFLTLSTYSRLYICVTGVFFRPLLKHHCCHLPICYMSLLQPLHPLAHGSGTCCAINSKMASAMNFRLHYSAWKQLQTSTHWVWMCIDNIRCARRRIGALINTWDLIFITETSNQVGENNSCLNLNWILRKIAEICQNSNTFFPLVRVLLCYLKLIQFIYILKQMLIVSFRPGYY